MNETELNEKNSFDGGLVYGASKFNTDSGRSNLMGTNSDDAQIWKMYGDIETGLIKDAFVRYRNCVCGKNNYRVSFIRCGFKFVICDSCGTLYTNPILKDEILEDFYVTEHKWAGVLANDIQTDLDAKKFGFGLKQIELYKKEKGTLLDIGCGPGLFLKIATQAGWMVRGIEFNQLEVESARANGLDVSSLDIFSPEFDDCKFDVICMWEVLEHLSEPAKVIDRVRSLLTSEGLLLILVPNGGSFLNRCLHEKSDTFTGFCHLTFFDPKTMRSFLEREGFQILNLQTIVSESNSIKNHMSYSNAYLGSSDFDAPFLTPEFLHDNLLGCKLLTIARRV
jgi:2-polyprenyl-3-methyl-5-hydroxy-6-metoxy-1,4-benzoquinol methylase